MYWLFENNLQLFGLHKPYFVLNADHCNTYTFILQTLYTYLNHAGPIMPLT